MRLVFEFDAIEGPGEQEPGIFKADDADLVALVNYGQQLADEMSGAFSFRFGTVYTEAGIPPAGPGSEGAVTEVIAGLRGSHEEPARGLIRQPAAGSGLAAARTVTGATASGPAGGIVLTRDQIREWTGLDLTPAEMDRLASCIPGSSIPDAIGAIVTDAMGLSGPGEEDEVPPPAPSRAQSRAAAGNGPRRRGVPVDPGSARRPSR